MGNSSWFLQRINYSGDLAELMSQVCADYKIGNYRSHKMVTIGYEDFNLILVTDKGKYFAKLFGSFRSKENCQRYIDVIEKLLKVGVNYPKLFSSTTGSLGVININGQEIRMILMEFIDGESFYDKGEIPNEEDTRMIVEQAAKINSIDYKPPYLYDDWAPCNLVDEFSKKKNSLDTKDLVIVKSVVNEFGEVGVEGLPHALGHGDIIGPNVIKSETGKIYIIDASVANWYPRIQELAIILCGLFFDPRAPSSIYEKYKLVLSEYQKHVELSPQEIKVLPVFFKAVCSIYILNASYEKSHGNSEGENDYWLELGRKGLRLSKQLT